MSLQYYLMFLETGKPKVPCSRRQICSPGFDRASLCSPTVIWYLRRLNMIKNIDKFQDLEIGGRLAKHCYSVSQTHLHTLLIKTYKHSHCLVRVRVRAVWYELWTVAQWFGSNSVRLLMCGRWVVSPDN